MPSLTLYMNPMSRGRIARWMMEKAGQPCEVVNLNYGAEINTPRDPRLNPMGKVPVLVQGEAVVTEAAAICACMAASFPEADLAPAPGTPEGAACFRWPFFAAGPVEAAAADRAPGAEIPAERRALVGYGSCDRRVAVLGHAVSQGRYIAGDRFTAADVHVGAPVGRGLKSGTLPDRPAFAACRERPKVRPALPRATAAHDADLPKEDRP